jgi:hypothetical protein
MLSLRREGSVIDLALVGLESCDRDIEVGIPDDEEKSRCPRSGLPKVITTRCDILYSSGS